MLHAVAVPITSPNRLTITAAIAKRVTVRIRKPIVIAIADSDPNPPPKDIISTTKVLVS
jgi:hypothetical protein